MTGGSRQRGLVLARFLAVLLAMAMLTAGGCGPAVEGRKEAGKLTVVTTLFPLYDFARQIGGDRAEVTLLLPPGVEPHSFEPRPGDVARIESAGLFVYTGPFMEPWAESILKGMTSKGLVVVNASRGVTLRSGEGDHHHRHEDKRAGHSGGHGEKPGGVDPHIWLDLDNARLMVEGVTAGFVQADGRNREIYEQNGAALKARLADLDARFREGLKTCRTRTFVHGGHYAFGYLAQRYGLTYVAAYQASPDAEPSPKRLVEVKKRMNAEGIRYVFYEELIEPRVATMLARETGASLLPLHGVHNVTREEIKGGASFFSLMEENLTNLRKGLECR